MWPLEVYSTTCPGCEDSLNHENWSTDKERAKVKDEVEGHHPAGSDVEFLADCRLPNKFIKRAVRGCDKLPIGRWAIPSCQAQVRDSAPSIVNRHRAIPFHLAVDLCQTLCKHLEKGGLLIPECRCEE